MDVSARRAEVADLGDVVDLYRRLATEQSAIRSIWPSADGLAEPIDLAFVDLLGREDATVIVGEIDGTVLGFLVTVEEPLLAPFDNRHVGVIRLIFSDHGARGVGVGAAMLDVAMEVLAHRGIDLYDAKVSPGHRMAKNFFESNGFKARSITMHRSDAEPIVGARDRIEGALS